MQTAGPAGRRTEGPGKRPVNQPAGRGLYPTRGRIAAGICVGRGNSRQEIRSTYAMALILIIDDDDMIRMTLSRALKMPGYEVVTARDGAEGIALFRQLPIDLVVTDVRMPGLSGPEVIKVLHADRPEVPVIIVGGSGSIPPNGAQSFARQAGADLALHKPFSMHDLIAAATSLLSAVRA